MFCPTCGKADQKENTYCRACGEFLNYSKSGSALMFGGKTPQQNVNSINIISLIAGIASLLAGIWMYATSFSVPVVLYLGAAILICNTMWHFSNFFVGVRLKKRLEKARNELSENVKQITSNETRELLNEPNPENFIQPSVVEDTTRKLTKTKQ